MEKKMLLQLLRHLKFALFCWGADAQTSKALLDDKSKEHLRFNAGSRSNMLVH